MYRDDDPDRPRPRRSRATAAVLAGRGGADGDPLNQPPVFASAFRACPERGYARDGNPTWAALEQALGELDGGEAVAYSSGMAAIAAVLELLGPRARVAAGPGVYAEARELFERRAAQGAIELVRIDAFDPARAAGQLDGVELLWLDAIANPGLEIAPIDALAAAARERGALVGVDATLATPMLVRPLELGADLVVHSATKHVGGHSDLLLGVAVAADSEVASRLREARSALGAVPGTMDAWLALRGLRTLAIRIERGERTATELAGRLEGLEPVASVRYPGLPADPAHAAARRLFDGFGTMLCFELRAGAAAADRVCREVRVLTHATSLGGVETLIERPGAWNPAVAAGLLRVSAGCEDPDDLWADLERAIALSDGARAPAPAGRTTAPSRRTAPR